MSLYINKPSFKKKAFLNTNKVLLFAKPFTKKKQFILLKKKRATTSKRYLIPKCSRHLKREVVYNKTYNNNFIKSLVFSRFLIFWEHPKTVKQFFITNYFKLSLFNRLFASSFSGI